MPPQVTGPLRIHLSLPTTPISRQRNNFTRLSPSRYAVKMASDLNQGMGMEQSAGLGGTGMAAEFRPGMRVEYRTQAAASKLRCPPRW